MMTKQEILALQPGPETDRLVAEKVMGWGGNSEELLWSPSGDIRAAWEVVQYLVSRYNISAYTSRDPFLWFVQLISTRTWETEALVCAKDLPLAICYAALLVTVGREE